MEIDNLIKAINRNSELQEKVLLKLDNLCEMMSNHKNNIDLSQDLLDSVDIQSVLKVSKSTLYRLKRDKSINPTRIGKRNYYSISEIKKAMPRTFFS